MDKQELYKQKLQAQVKEWEAKVTGMNAQLERLTVEAKLEVQSHLDAVHAKFTAAKATFDEIGAATEETWDSATTRVDGIWSELKASADGAYRALRNHKSGGTRPANSSN